MNLNELAAAVVEQSTQKRDLTLDTQADLEMVTRDGRLAFHIAGLNETVGITENARRQVASRLSVPWKYFDRLTADYPDLVCENVNTLMKGEGRRAMLRLLGDDVRAVLSDKYLRIDNEPIMTAALQAVKDSGARIQFLQNNVSSDRLYMRGVLPDLAFDAGPATGATRRGSSDRHTIMPGFQLRNSETGKGALHIDGFTCDNYCLNGLVFGRTDFLNYSRRHLGAAVIEGTDYRVITNETIEREVEAACSAVRDIVCSMTNEERFEEMREAIMAARDTDRVKTPGAAVRQLADSYGLSESESENTLVALAAEQDMTMFGMSSAVTAMARDIDDFERRVELETIGADILSMDLSRWDAVVHAELPDAA